MLSTGVRTPVGVKVMGTSLGEIEKIGVALEGMLRPLRGTRSAYYERNTGGLYLDIIPDRDAIARYGLTVGDLNRVIEASIGGTPISGAPARAASRQANIGPNRKGRGSPASQKTSVPSTASASVPRRRGGSNRARDGGT